VWLRRSARLHLNLKRVQKKYPMDSSVPSKSLYRRQDDLGTSRTHAHAALAISIKMHTMDQVIRYFAVSQDRERDAMPVRVKAFHRHNLCVLDDSANASLL
jgi:hypothetical protein